MVIDCRHVCPSSAYRYVLVYVCVVTFKRVLACVCVNLHAYAGVCVFSNAGLRDHLGSFPGFFPFLLIILLLYAFPPQQLNQNQLEGSVPLSGFLVPISLRCVQIRF